MLYKGAPKSMRGGKKIMSNRKSHDAKGEKEADCSFLKYAAIWTLILLWLKVPNLKWLLILYLSSDKCFKSLECLIGNQKIEHESTSMKNGILYKILEKCTNTISVECPHGPCGHGSLSPIKIAECNLSVLFQKECIIWRQ